MFKKKSQTDEKQREYLAKLEKNLAKVRYFTIYFWGRNDFKKVTREQAIRISFAKKYGHDFYLEGGSYAGKSVCGVEPIPEQKRVLDRKFQLSSPRELSESEIAEQRIKRAYTIMKTSFDLYKKNIISKKNYEEKVLRYESLKNELSNLIKK